MKTLTVELYCKYLNADIVAEVADGIELINKYKNQKL